MIFFLFVFLENMEITKNINSLFNPSNLSLLWENKIIFETEKKNYF